MQACQHEFVVTKQLVDEIRCRVETADSPDEVVSRVVDVLVAAEVNLREAPSLEQMKRLLIEAFRSARLPCTVGPEGV